MSSATESASAADAEGSAAGGGGAAAGSATPALVATTGCGGSADGVLQLAGTRAWQRSDLAWMAPMDGRDASVDDARAALMLRGDASVGHTKSCRRLEHSSHWHVTDTHLYQHCAWQSKTMPLLTAEELAELERIEARIARMPADCPAMKWSRLACSSRLKLAKERQQAGTRRQGDGCALALARKYLRVGKRARAHARRKVWASCKAVAETIWPSLLDTDYERRFATELKVIEAFFDYVQANNLQAWAMVSYRDADHDAMVNELSVKHFMSIRNNRVLRAGMGDPELHPAVHVIRFVQHVTSYSSCPRRVRIELTRHDARHTAPVKGSRLGRPGSAERAQFRASWGPSSPNEQKQSTTPCAASTASAGEVFLCRRSSSRVLV